MNSIVFIVPTGIGAEIGGHAGDANPVAKLFASLCDNLITHPNVLNASDINEMTENTLYVEGSILDRFLNNQIFLEKVSFNRILLAVNKPTPKEIINSVSAARATIGADIKILELETPLRMVGRIENGTATGDIYGWEELVKQLGWYRHTFDALAISSPINVDRKTKLNYFRNGGINPWGGVEAMASRLIASKLNKPVAHAPIDELGDDIEIKDLHENLIVDPRIAAEMVSICYLHSVLKGLHRAPRISDRGLSVKDVSFLITPINCVGKPHRACLDHGIPVIAVRENKTCLNDEMPDDFIIVENYLEAAGIVACVKAGIQPSSIRRPLPPTEIIR